MFKMESLSKITIFALKIVKSGLEKFILKSLHVRLKKVIFVTEFVIPSKNLPFYDSRVFLNPFQTGYSKLAKYQVQLKNVKNQVQIDRRLIYRTEKFWNSFFYTTITIIYRQKIVNLDTNSILTMETM